MGSRRWRRGGGEEEAEEDEAESYASICGEGDVRGGGDHGDERAYIASVREGETQRTVDLHFSHHSVTGQNYQI